MPLLLHSLRVIKRSRDSATALSGVFKQSRDSATALFDQVKSGLASLRVQCLVDAVCDEFGPRCRCCVMDLVLKDVCAYNGGIHQNIG